MRVSRGTSQNPQKLPVTVREFGNSGACEVLRGTGNASAI